MRTAQLSAPRIAPSGAGASALHSIVDLPAHVVPTGGNAANSVEIERHKPATNTAPLSAALAAWIRNNLVMYLLGALSIRSVLLV